MRSALLWMALAGCSGTASDTSPRVTPAPAVAALDAPVAAGSGSGSGSGAAVPPPAAPPAFQAVTAPPGGKLTRVAVAPAGDAALTLDAADEVRLWPTLDGTREPLVVDLPVARAIALQRAGNELVAVLVIAGGTLIVRLDEHGHRVAVHELPAFDGVAAHEAGFVGWRGAHVSWFDADGTVGRTVDSKAEALAAAKPAPSPVTLGGSDLILATPDGPRYLGYAFPNNGLVLSGDADHVLVPGAAGRWLRLDAKLASAQEIVPWAPAKDPARSIAWLGGHDWLVQRGSGLAVWTEGATTSDVALPGAKLTAYDADSHLLLLAGAGAKTAANKLARYVPDRHTLEPVAFTGWGDATTTPYLLSPSLAHGAVLLISSFDRDKQGKVHGSAHWFHDLADPAHGRTDWSDLDAWVVGTNEAGEVQINQQGDRPSADWLIVQDGAVVRSVPRDGVWLSPDGARYFTREERTLRLFTIADKMQWQSDLPGADPVWNYGGTWLDSTHAVLMSTTHGMAAIDLATGAFTAAPAGWGFELGAAIHPVSTVGHPMARDLAVGRDGPLSLAGDTAFQALATDVAAKSSSLIVWWGPITLDGALVRCAYLENGDQRGDVLGTYLVETAPDAVLAITVSAWGFSMFQGVLPPHPTWGQQGGRDGNEGSGHTVDVHELTVSAKWIHGSFETLAFTVEHGRVVVTSDDWAERENNGRSIDTTTGGGTFASGRRPLLTAFKSHAMAANVSDPSRDADELAAGIHEIHRADP